MTQQPQELLATLDSLGIPRVLVLGDLMIDRYTFGDAQRVSQEAPVLVLNADRFESRLGGASSVCQLLRGLEAVVTCVGVVGDDLDGRDLRELLSTAGVDQSHVFCDPSRPTTVKQRFIGRAQNRHPHQILRVDREVKTPLCEALENQVIESITQLLPEHGVLLISDYGKGVCTPRVLQAVIAAAKKLKTPVLVDPIKISDYSRYRGASAVTPNRLETETATGVCVRTEQDALLAGKLLCEQAQLTAAIVTLDRDGMALVPPDGGGVLYPTRPRSVYDITGAGDMVLATLGVCVASGKTLAEAVQLANVSGGLEVEKVGVVPVTRAEMRHDLTRHDKGHASKLLTPAQAIDLLHTHRNRGQKIVFTNGCFDILHVGHVTYLEQAASLGEASVRQLKGPTRPVQNQQSRAMMLSSLSSVDYVVVFDELTPENMIHQLRPDILVKGGDYRAEDIVGRDFVESYGGQVCVVGLVDGVSTTRILNTVAATHRLDGPHVHRSPVVKKAG